MSDIRVMAPCPGIFHAQPSPDKPLYKQAGDSVAKGETVGLVEIMKTFHEVKSPADGVFGAYLANSGDAIEADQAVAKLSG